MQLPMLLKNEKPKVWSVLCVWGGEGVGVYKGDVGLMRPPARLIGI